VATSNSVTHIKSIYQEKSTDELIAIWRENDRSAYRAEVFSAIKDILIDRGYELPEQAPEPPPTEQDQRFVITGIDIPLWEIVSLMVKWSFASIPAFILFSLILSVLYMIVSAVLPGLSKLTP
jgi:hypothetical protein